MFKQIRKGVLLSLVMAATCLVAAPAGAADAKDLVLTGDAKCTVCHDASGFPQLFGIGKTKHGTRADGRTPTCTSCHGESTAHAGGSGKPDVIFGAKGASQANVQNGACLACHQKDSARHLWAGSVHEAREVACASCHNAHGSTGPMLMKRDTVSETCYTCHAEKRGPFVHDHPPVTENCAICHDVHGTTAQNLLKTRQPFLCQTCHTPHGPFPPGVATGGAPQQPGWFNGSTITQGRGCTNCHTQIHGSNNPSLLSPTPQRFFR